MPATASLPANNAVRMTSNGVILVVRTGQQTPDSMDVLLQKVERLIRRRRRHKQSVFILIDDSHVTGYDPAVQPKIINFMHTVDFDAVAVYGLNPLYRYLTDRLISGDHQGRRVSTFKTQHAAAEWLAEYVINAKAGSRAALR